MERMRWSRSRESMAAYTGSDAVGNKTGRRLGMGQLVYCVKWDGASPRLLEGQIIGMDDRSLIVRGTDGLFLDALLTLPVKGAFRQALDAIRAEMQWLRWFLPHDAVAGGDATSKRSQQIAELGQLEATMAMRCGRGRSRRRGVAA